MQQQQMARRLLAVAGQAPSGVSLMVVVLAVMVVVI